MSQGFFRISRVVSRMFQRSFMDFQEDSEDVSGGIMENIDGFRGDSGVLISLNPMEHPWNPMNSPEMSWNPWNVSETSRSPGTPLETNWDP